MPWEDPTQLAEKPVGGAEYGYVDQQGGHGGTRDELVAYAAGDAPMGAVWTPDGANLKLPEEVPFLFEAMQRRLAATARRKLQLCLGLFVIGGLYLWRSGQWARPTEWAFLLTGLAGLAAGWSLVSLVSARRLTPERMANTALDHRHRIWLARQKSETTKWIGWALLGVFAVQFFVVGLERSMDLAALDRTMVRLGQPWRLVTGPMLHAHPMHLLLNYGALLAFGRMTEVHAGRAYVPIIFFVSLLGGSLFSLTVGSGSSVGASGALMGFVGFMAVLGWRRRPFLPPGFFRTVMLDLVGVALFGIVGYAFIDNAGHLGGFLTGALLGALLIRRPAADEAQSQAPWSLAPGPGVRVAGNVALAATAGAALMAVAAILGQWQ